MDNQRPSNQRPLKPSKACIDDVVVTLRMKRKIVDLVDIERGKYSAPRSSWITQAVLEKLEKLGFDIF